MDSVMVNNAINVIRSALEDYFDNNISGEIMRMSDRN